MSEIIRRLEYIARVLDTPPYNTPDEVKAIREVIDCINRYDSLVAEVEQLKQLNEKLIIAKAGWYDRAEKAEAEAEKLSKHINMFQKSACMDSGCCPDDITNCAECIIKHF